MSQTSVGRFDAKIQRGRGKLAHKIGQTYDVHRLSHSSSGSITSGSPIYTGFPSVMRQITRRAAIENRVFDLLAYEGTCDGTKLNLQDVLVETGYGVVRDPDFGSNGGTFTLVQKRPMRENIFIRTESSASITRPVPKGGRADQQPASGAFQQLQYSGITKPGEQVLTLVDGLYVFAEAGASPAAIPIGIQPQNKIRDTTSMKLPTGLYREHFVIYIPLLPGQMINELDRINLGYTGDRYEVALVFTTENVGVSGYICIAEKLAT